MSVKWVNYYSLLFLYLPALLRVSTWQLWRVINTRVPHFGISSFSEVLTIVKDILNVGFFLFVFFLAGNTGSPQSYGICTTNVISSNSRPKKLYFACLNL